MSRAALLMLLALIALACDRGPQGGGHVAPAPRPQTPRRYPADYRPATFDDAVTYLCDTLDAPARERVRSTPEWDLVTLNWGWGRGLRNELGLLEPASPLRASCAARAGQPAVSADHASRMIIEAVWRRLRS